ncbi:MAG TPA: S41 family peptidase [Erysipelothrix sp.]|nr:S41 family peptidase [Erysipelothrix sp.]
MEENNNDKIKIKLERHKWPDELEKEKQNKRKFLINGISILLIFVVGFTFGAVFYTTDEVSGDVNVARFERVYDILVDKWYFKNDLENPEETLIENAIKGMIEQNGDNHTSYMTQEESQQFIDSIDMSFVGIGVQYQVEDSLITRVFKNSPAEKAGILAGDVMVSVDGMIIKDLGEDEDLKEYILGERGTSVKIGVDRQGETKEFDVTRDTVNALVWGEVVDDKTGYIEITSFGTSLAEAANIYLESFQKDGVENLIIDLRDNGGGYLDAINNISELFFEEGTTIYHEKFTNGDEVEYKVTKNHVEPYTYKKIVVLINENSASASEVLALALRDNLNATILGTNSFGKGTVQRQEQDGVDNSYLKYTFAKWYSPKKENIHEVGIAPDVEVKLDDVFYETYEELEETIKTYDIVDPSISFVQKGLKFLGYHTGRTDSYYDVKTKEALHKYKKDHNLKVDDTIDNEIVLNIYSAVVQEWNLNKKDHDTQYQRAIEVIELES